MPERILTPRRASYVMIGLALAVVILAVWNISLTRRVSASEAIRHAEARSAKARAASECRSRINGTRLTNGLLLAIRDLAKIPQTNLRTYLDGPLSDIDRANYEDALARYQRAEAKFATFPIPTCVRSDP